MVIQNVAEAWGVLLFSSTLSSRAVLLARRQKQLRSDPHLSGPPSYFQTTCPAPYLGHSLTRYKHPVLRLVSDFFPKSVPAFEKPSRTNILHVPEPAHSLLAFHQNICIEAVLLYRQQ